MGKYRCMGCMQEYDSTMNICPHCAYPKDTVQNEPYCLPEGTVLEDKYIVGKVLGSGSFSVTYLAWDLKQEKKVVIKEYFPKTLSSRMFGQRELNSYDGEKSKQFESGLMAFAEESNNLKNLSQSLDGIVDTIDVFIENSTAYSVTEYIDGITLDKVLQKNKIPWEDVIQIMEPLLNSMKVIQDNSMVCYSISPDNIMMTRDKKVKLLGFGTSKFATGGATMDFGLVTKSGYSPVEMYRDGMKQDNSIDVYSLAAVIYYAVTGIVPPSAVDRSAKDDLLSPAEMGIDIPRNANTAIMNALNVNAKYRTKDCASFLSELKSADAVQRIYEPKEKEETGKMSKKTKTIIITVAIIAVALIIGIVFAARGIISTSNNSGEVIGNLVQMQKDDAIKKLDDFGIEYEIIGTAELEGVKEGEELIAFQSVSPNTKIKDITKMELKVAKPVTEKFKVPLLTALTKNEAIEELKKAGIKNYSFKYKETNQYKSGRICEQSISAGKECDEKTKIVVYIAQNSSTTAASTASTKRSVTTTTRRTTQKKTNRTAPTAERTTKKQTTKKSTTKKSTTKPTTRRSTTVHNDEDNVPTFGE